MSRKISHSFPDGVTVTYHENKRAADKESNTEARRKRVVSRSVSLFRDPISGVQTRLHVVTSRPPSAWQKHAQHEGYGVK